MSNIRRHHIPNAAVFMTAVCSQREKTLKGDESKELLTSVLAEVTTTSGVSIIGYIILDDHFHWMVDLSGTSSPVFKNLEPEPHPVDPGAIQAVREPSFVGHPDLRAIGTNLVGQVATNGSYLTAPMRTNKTPTISEIMQSIKLRFTYRYKKAKDIRSHVVIWQRRFWDHIIRDQNDYNVHLDYIHFNPVKHGYAAGPGDYPWSSFGRYLEAGIYPPDWGCTGELPHLKGKNWE